MKNVTLLDPHLMELEESLAKGEAPSSTGGVYFAWSPCLRCREIGATRKEDPQVRLQQLSRYMAVPSRGRGASSLRRIMAGTEVVAEEACDERRQLGQYCLIKSS